MIESVRSTWYCLCRPCRPSHALQAFAGKAGLEWSHSR